MYRNNLKNIDSTLYTLERELGTPIFLRKPIVNDYDVTTGDAVRRYEVVKIRRAILLPSTVARDFVYDLTYVAANKNFAYGGFFDKDTRIFMLRKSIDIDTTWQLIHQTKVYGIVNFETSGPVLIAAKALEGTERVNDPYGSE